jgi:HTH-type transcriptional regulator, sugar sensing transcriptional regulator
MYEQVLEDIGFSKNESKGYLALLELGSATAGQVAEKSKVHRTNIYDALDRMVERGIVSYKMVSNVKYFQATPPENLFRLLKEKEQRLKSVLPELLLKLQMSETKSEAHIFEGCKAFMDLYYGFLKYKEEILVYGLTKDVPVMLRTYLPHYHKERIAQNVPIKHIYNHDAGERIDILNKMELTEAKSLPEKFDSHVSTWVCGDEVVLTVWTKPPLSIQIINRKLADAYKKYFEILWKETKIPL